MKKSTAMGSLSLVTVLGAAALFAAGVSAREPGPSSAAGSKAASFKTPWGHPDLQGTWTNTTTTPLERPGDLAGKATLTPEERAARDAAAAKAIDAKPSAGNTGAYNSFWMDSGKALERTSLIVDPPDGQLPALTAAAQKRADEVEAVRRQPMRSWLDVNAYDRCITRGLPGAMMPGFYNHNYQILQTPDYVAILVEMIHETRIIPLNGRTHFTPRVKQWMGDSVGRWEGQTLVVETKNFNDKINEVSGNAMRFPDGTPQPGRYHGVFATPGMTLVERFTRIDANTIDYQFTVSDPNTFVKPWTAMAPMTKLATPVFEYACHEGNHAIPNMLSAARAQEQQAAGGKTNP